MQKLIFTVAKLCFCQLTLLTVRGWTFQMRVQSGAVPRGFSTNSVWKTQLKTLSSSVCSTCFCVSATSKEKTMPVTHTATHSLNASELSHEVTLANTVQMRVDSQALHQILSWVAQQNAEEETPQIHRNESRKVRLCAWWQQTERPFHVAQFPHFHIPVKLCNYRYQWISPADQSRAPPETLIYSFDISLANLIQMVSKGPLENPVLWFLHDHEWEV